MAHDRGSLIIAGRKFVPGFFLRDLAEKGKWDINDVKNGVELGRIEGYASEDFFWFHVEQLLAAHPEATDGTGQP